MHFSDKIDEFWLLDHIFSSKTRKVHLGWSPTWFLHRELFFANHRLFLTSSFKEFYLLATLQIAHLVEICAHEKSWLLGWDLEKCKLMTLLLWISFYEIVTMKISWTGLCINFVRRRRRFLLVALIVCFYACFVVWGPVICRLTLLLVFIMLVQRVLIMHVTSEVVSKSNESLKREILDS